MVIIEARHLLKSPYVGNKCDEACTTNGCQHCKEYLVVEECHEGVMDECRKNKRSIGLGCKIYTLLTISAK